MSDRRTFIKATGLASAGVLLTGMGGFGGVRAASSYNNIIGSGKKINLACVGIGNRGEEVINELYKTGLANIVALCDVDLGAKHTQAITAKFPQAKKFKDFRQMFDKASGEFDAVAVMTPDHAHFPICMAAFKAGKHIFVEKPLTRTFLESELLLQASRKYKNVVTQMGNQGHSDANYFQFKAWKEAGIIKDVTAINAHMNNPRRWHSWDPNMKRFPAEEPIPETLDWDTWLSAVAYHDYIKDFHYGQWRCWYDFGMGALGDWGAHILDTAHEFLELGLPEEVNPLKLEGHNDFFFPMSSIILFKFPKRKNMPAVNVTWYDGVNNLPPLPKGYGVSEIDPNIPQVAGFEIERLNLNPGKEIYSKELTFKGGSHGSTLSIIPDEKAKAMASKLPPVPKSPSNHFANFLLACQGREKTRSPFEVAVPLSQVFCLGVITQKLNRKIRFDRATGQITGDPIANAMLAGAPPRKEWREFYTV